MRIEGDDASHRRGKGINITRLYKARKLLELSRKSGYLIDVTKYRNPLVNVRASIDLLTNAIETEEEYRHRDH